MNIQFHIDYQTYYGQDLVLNIITGQHNGAVEASQYRMRTSDGYHWEVEVKKDAKPGTHIDYFYSILCGDNEQRKEWGVINHRLDFDTERSLNYRVYDHWSDIPENAYLYTSAITDCVAGKKLVKGKLNNYNKAVTLKVRAPQLGATDELYLVGAEPTLGAWNVKKALKMVQHNINEWSYTLDATKLVGDQIEVKFFIKSNENLVWEYSDNRTLLLPTMDEGDVVVYELTEAYFPLPAVRVAGTLVPVFSLRSETSFGIGDFGDLKKMVDWISKTHQRALQILPINDTTITHTWTDSYPYSCISIFALHPQYVDLTALPALKDKKQQEKFEKLRKELNALPQIDYERVNDAKNEYLRLLFEQEGAKVLESSAFKKFFAETERWLVPYAQYSYMRDKFGTADFSHWSDHKQWDEADRKALSNPKDKAYKEVAFFYYVQFVLSTQLKAVHEYAQAHKIILKGDIPIGVNRYGCDVWTEPRYFNLNGQAGAPPDDFSVNGQNWGFPTYNWDEMIKDGCQWWVNRFQNMAQYFDAYRIDHVLGFFRIWEIPIHSVHGLLGQFAPALGMSREEIEGYGLHWQEELFTEPFIADWILDRIFREHADEVRQKYVEHVWGDRYKMRPAYDTQRKVEKAFAGKTSDVDIWLRDGLYALISNVLFVRDHKDPNRFHPRICVQFDFIYESLYDSDKAIFNKLYNDYYYRRNNQFWYQEAMKKLPKLVNATRMLVCAEDLGMVPDCVAWVMNELRILSLEIQSMPKNPKVRFGYLSENPYRSVSTISTHDMATLRQWWDEDWERAQDYFNSMLHRGGPAPHPLPGWLARDIVSRHLTSPSMLCILGIQDWMSIDEELRLADPNAERINVPSNPKHYWRYRMHVSIEDLMKNASFNEQITDLINQAGR
ncbi:4-alpha-glucanotransferase [Prevotella melaninogenica]|uniref:4-alpha-glucanotransferase n=1 Tax=Prevotella melaninogenica TaxID=28132 RepID=UPI001BA98040|nr:4-alpha-glucanotransferase [Prevotella melaninogenica]QUB67979.1 4-alpha-glucanotransferase [Prevotella melaninogenica]